MRVRKDTHAYIYVYIHNYSINMKYGNSHQHYAYHKYDMLRLSKNYTSIWLLGLGVWFSLRVREVPGSIPGAAQYFVFCNLPYVQSSHSKTIIVIGQLYVSFAEIRSSSGARIRWNGVLVQRRLWRGVYCWVKRYIFIIIQWRAVMCRAWTAAKCWFFMLRDI